MTRFGDALAGRTVSRREALRFLGLVGAGGAAIASGCGTRGGAAGSASSEVFEEGDRVVVEEPTAEAPAAEEQAGSTLPSQDLPRSEEPSELARMLDAGEVSSIRLIGDSITAGYGCDGYGEWTDRVIYEGSYGGFPESAPSVGCWANDFRAYAGERGVASFVNAGISGAKMWWLAEEPEAWIQEGADVIFVMLGTNDAVYSTVEEYQANAEAALAAVSGACRLMVVLSPPANERTDAANSFGMDVIDAALRDICDSHGYLHVSLLDVLGLYTDDFNEDQCHPSTAGSHKLWEHLKAALGL